MLRQTVNILSFVSDYTNLGRSLKRYEPLLKTGVSVQDSSGLVKVIIEGFREDN